VTGASDPPAPVTPPATPAIAHAFPWPAAGLLVALTIVMLHFEGHRLWCACGQYNLWSSGIASPHCSQHLFDSYSFTHIEHGLIAWIALSRVFPLRSVNWRLFVTLAYACSWEVFENSAFIIQRFRTKTIALHYFGDSIANSLGDILCCMFGLLIARKLGLRWTLVLFAGIEILLAVTVRDNLTLNVIMLLHPLEAIKSWQMSG
jgi:hypothetical protein